MATVGIGMPGPDRLPPGRHRDLVEALHELYRGAGKPGLRRIMNAVKEGDFRDTVSHEKISTMLRGSGGLPSWTKLEPVVRVLANWNPARLDADVVSARIQQLWHRAQTDEPDAASTQDADALVRLVSSEVAARARNEHQTESERGYRDGIAFARELPSWRQLEELADNDFRVRPWLKPQLEHWIQIAAGHAPDGVEIPEWAWKAARRLGSVADTVGYDEFSFTPTDTYLDAFGAGLRAVWEAARSEAATDRGGGRGGDVEHSMRTSRPPVRATWKSERDRLVGLAPFKEMIDDLVLRVRMRRARGGDVPLPRLLFVGPPGTGKTEAARLTGPVLRDLGLLKRGHVVEVSGTDFAGEYIGQAADRTRQAIRSALDGVLFIDGALSLADRSRGIFGMEAIDTLVTEMERHPDRLVVIAAGRPDDLGQWNESNPGLASRFAPRVDFPPYTDAELLELLRRAAAAEGYDLLPETADRAAGWLAARRAARPSDFGNALVVRELLAMMESRMARRVDATTSGSISTFIADDVPTLDRVN